MSLAHATKKIVLLDTHAILHRAYHSIPDFTNDAGEPTGALYGLALLLIKLVKEFSPEHIVACYDLPQATFRHKEFKDYKAGRQKVDQALIDQIKRAPLFFAALGIPVLSFPGFEADDMIGTVVEQITKRSKEQGARSKKNTEDFQIIIASGDMDTLQLVEGNRVVVYTLRKGIKDTVVYNEAGVRERFGFGPKLLTDYKGLRGDPSDNIPGVKGIGEKTATDIIKNFGTIEELYKALKAQSTKHPPERGRSDRAGKTPNSSVLKPRIVELLLASEEEALFSKMLGTIRRDAPIVFALPATSFKEAFDEEKAEKFFQKLGFRSLLPRVKEIKNSGIGSLASGSELEARLLPQRLPSERGPQIELFAPSVDTHSVLFQEVAIATWLADPSLTNPTPEAVFKHTGTKTLAEAKKVLEQELKKTNVERVYTDLELPLIPILERAQKHGVLVDPDCLKKLSTSYHKELSSLEKSIWKHAGEEFNINSPKQMGEILFVKLALAENVKGLKKTAGGAASTKVSELEKIKDQHVIVPLILGYREYQKLLSTYIDVIPTLLGKDNRLHARMVQTGAATGRMSCVDPNLQNIPVKTELGRAIRNAFIAPEGTVLAAFDYSQIDLRVAAFLSEDPELVQIFVRGEDVHTGVAARVFGVAPDAVDKEMRRRAKVINFGILYGMGVNALRQNLGTDRKEAEQFYNAYFERFHVLRDYLEATKASALKLGYTTTYFGRRRYYPKIKSTLPYIRTMEERMAMNAPIQGTTADIMKLAMIKIDETLREAKLDRAVVPLLQVHDELIYEIKDEAVTKAERLIKETMENVIKVSVPLVANASAGKSWGELRAVRSSARPESAKADEAGSRPRSTDREL